MDKVKKNVCIECAHCVDVQYHDRWCGRKAYIDVDIVMGRESVKGRLNLYDERDSILPWKCGKQGRFFVAKVEE